MSDERHRVDVEAKGAELRRPAAIFFDLDDTILQCEGGDPLTLWMESVEEFVEHFQGIDATTLFEAIRVVAKEFWADPDRHREGRLNIRNARREHVKQAARNLGRPNDKAAARLADRYHDRREGNVSPFDGAIETLRHVRGKSIRTALITNGSSDVQRAKIDKFALDKFFDLVLVEGEFGVGKPDEKVYRHALDALGVVPSETWMIGDSLEWEVRAPQQLGIFAIWNDFRGAGLPAGCTVRPDRIVGSVREIIGMLA